MPAAKTGANTGMYEEERDRDKHLITCQGSKLRTSPDRLCRSLAWEEALRLATVPEKVEKCCVMICTSGKEEKRRKDGRRKNGRRNKRNLQSLKTLFSSNLITKF
jgi:hypothetical protein